MSVALRGNLRDFGIADVFQLIGQQRKTGLLDITSRNQTMRLAFDQGRVVWARPLAEKEDGVLGERLVRCGLLTKPQLEKLQQESDVSARPLASLVTDTGKVSSTDVSHIEELVTNETIFVVLRWSEGSFDFSAQTVRHTKPPDRLLAAEQILMDGLRMVDEWQTFANLVPDGETVFERCGRLDALRERMDGEARPRLSRIEKVFALVDGRLPVQRVIDLSRLGLFDATRALAELRHNGLIQPVKWRPRLKGERSPRPVVKRARWWIAAAFPLALLSLVVSLIWNRSPAGTATASFPIVRAPLETARANFEKRRLRNALETHRMLQGRWPADLRQVAESDLLSQLGGGDTLTPADGPPYYYARRGNGVLLLAPER